MRVRLMDLTRDADTAATSPREATQAEADLGIGTVLDAMARGDAFLHDVARAALLGAIPSDVQTVRYRQENLADALRNPDAVRALYGLAVEGVQRHRQAFFGLSGRYPGGVLYGAVDLMRRFDDVLRELRALADSIDGRFASRGFTGLFSTLREELTDTFFREAETHLATLDFKRGVVLGAGLGAGNQIARHVLLGAGTGGPQWLRRLLGRTRDEQTVYVDSRDDAGLRELGDIRDRAIDDVANALAQSAEHVLHFFELLRTEVGFYVCCLNLHERLVELGSPSCIPDPRPAADRALRFAGLYDLSLALSMGGSLVGNEADADGKPVVIVTGANQGGKSSWLRGVGLALVMMHAGMFVAAESFSGSLCSGLFTHYRREEDATLTQGKLDEEMGRLSEIVDAVEPHGVVLFNESFSATNEREGSEIARQVVGALVERRIRVLFVTHLFAFAHGMRRARPDDTLFLRAERLDDGTRTFRLVPGEPLETSYGPDLWIQVFGAGWTDVAAPTTEG